MRKSNLSKGKESKRAVWLSGALFLSFFLTAPGVSADGIQIRPLFRLGRDTAQAEPNPEIIVPKPMTLPGENSRQGRTERVASLAPPPPPAVPAGESLLSAPPAELSDDDSLFVARTISTETDAEPAAADTETIATDSEPIAADAEPASPSAGESAPASPAETADAAAAEPAAAGPDSGKPGSYTTKGETLEEAWTVALAASRSLSAQDYQRLGAEATVDAARAAGLPKLTNVTGVHTMSEELAIKTDVPMSQLIPTLPDISLQTPINDKDFATASTAVTIPIYMGGRVLNMIEAAEAASCALGAGRQISEQDLKYEVAKTYFLVLRIRHLYAVAADAEQTVSEHVKDAQRLFDNGIVTKNVLLAAEVAHANAKQDLIKAENAVNLSQAAYNRLLWRPLDTAVEIADVDIPPLSGDLESLTSQAVSRRPELAALSHKSRALAAKSRVYRADRLPQVAAIGTHEYIENSHLNENSFFTGSLGVAWTPFDGGVSRNRQAATEYEAMSVTREYEEAESKIRLQVYQCWQDEQETRHRVEAAEKAVESADENLRVVTRGFREGVTNHTEVLDAMTLRTLAQSNLANACYDAVLATYHLQRATGQL